MADQEIEAIRALLLAKPRPDKLSERRQRLDALGTQYQIAQGRAYRVHQGKRRQSGMVIDPGCRPCMRDPIPTWWWLCVWFTR